MAVRSRFVSRQQGLEPLPFAIGQFVTLHRAVAPVWSRLRIRAMPGCPEAKLDIAAWLQSLDLTQYAEAFRANDVDADVLPELTAEDLKALGVASVGNRRRQIGRASWRERVCQYV